MDTSNGELIKESILPNIDSVERIIHIKDPNNVRNIFNFFEFMIKNMKFNYKFIGL